MRRLPVVCVVLGLLSAAVLPLGAQQPTTADLARILLGRAADKPPKACVDKISEAMQANDGDTRRGKFEDLLNPNTSPLCATFLILSSTQFERASTASKGQFLEAAEKQYGVKALALLKAVAQQEGSSNGTGGSTSLTTKGLTSRLLSVASEYGALTQSTSSNTTTISGTLAGLPVVLMQKGALLECSVKVLAFAPCLHAGVLKWMSRASYSVSYDTSTGSGTTVGTVTGSTGSTAAAQPVTVSSNSHGVNAVSGKMILIAGKLNTAAYADADKTVAASDAIDVVLAAQEEFRKLEQITDANSAYVAFVSGPHGNDGEAAHLNAFSAGHSATEVAREWRAAADELTASLGASRSISTTDALANTALLQAARLVSAYLRYLGDEEAAGFTAVLAAPPVLTASYDWNRPSSAPSNSVFRVIYQKTYRPLTLTLNGAVSIYDQAQPNVPDAGRLRDTQFAAELAHPFAFTLPGGSAATNFTLSGSFYDQYQSSPAILNVTPGAPVDGVTFTGLPSAATQVYGTKGNIAIGQLKLTAGGGSAITVPLSITYSNRTELITTPTWRAQIGVSYDLDSLFAGK